MTKQPIWKLITNLGDTHPLKYYGDRKVQAMEFRLAGNIPAAIQLENYCDTTYAELPPALQW